MKVTIVGTGFVGASLAYVLVLDGLADELVLINRSAEKSRGHQIDLQHTSSFTRDPVNVISGEVSDSKDSDVVVFTASVPMNPNMSDRQVLSEGNARLIRELMPKLAEASPNAVFLMVTNPIDVMTWATLQVTDLPPERVCGIGTLVDSARFRALLSEELAIHPGDIRAYILGEHGASQVAAISVANVGGEPIDASLEVARRFAKETTDAGFEILKLKGHTNFAVAKATAVVIEAILHDQHRTFPLSVLLNGYCGIEDVCLSIPVVMGRAGVSRYLFPKLAHEEEVALRKSAETVRQTNQRILPILQGKST